MASTYTHWRRPARSRMYDYNYEYGSSYYRPQVRYIGETIDPKTRRSRRRTISPPGARTFSERWAANPFYGRCEPISEYDYARNLERGRSRLIRASSVPALYAQNEQNYQSIENNMYGRSISRARSVSRERSIYRGESVATTTRARSVTRGRSMTRARSVSRAGSVYEGDYEESRGARGRSRSYYDDTYYYDPLSDKEWERLLKVSSREEREKSIFQLRMALENPRELPKKKMMQTTVGHGIYQSTLYGTETWDPAEYISGRQ